MIRRALAWVQAQALAIMGAALVASLAWSGVLFVQLHGLKVGPLAIKGCRAMVAEWKFAAEETAKAAKASEERRAEERAGAVTSYADQSTTCETRVSNAREAGRIIERVTTVVQDSDTNGGADRIIGADSLRNIIGQSAGREAGGLSAGNVRTDDSRAGVAE